jgi:hypothetical protein
MANIELINLVTTELVQRKKMVEYRLRNESNSVDGKPNEVIESLREYNQIVSDIQLWESLINEITPPQNDEGENNN